MNWYVPVKTVARFNCLRVALSRYPVFPSMASAGTVRAKNLCTMNGLMHCTNFVSLDHRVAVEQRWRDLNAELFYRLEIYYQFELGRLHNRAVQRAFRPSRSGRHRHMLAAMCVRGKLVPWL